MATNNNEYFDHDTSRITQKGIGRLIDDAGENLLKHRQVLFSDPQLLSAITVLALNTIKTNYRTNVVLIAQMNLLDEEIKRYVHSGYKTAFLERLVIGTDTAMIAVNEPTNYGADSQRYVNNPEGYTLVELYKLLVSNWPIFDLTRNEVISLNESTRNVLNIDIELREIQADESFIAGATFTNSPASKIPDKIKRQGVPSYTGVDITVVATMGPFISAIDDIKTITYSTHRQVGNVFAFGHTNRKGIVRGPRTVAGTIICTVRLDDPMLKLHPEWMTGESKQAASNDPFDLYKQTILSDQLPMFDILITFQNEVGYASVMSIFGINITDVGQVMSIADNEIEMTLTYGAIDVDILRYVGYDKEGNIRPYDTEAYKNRRRKIIYGETVSNNPYIIPKVPDPASFGGYEALL